MRGTFGDEDCQFALQALFGSLRTFNHLMSMFAPFTAEMIHQNLRRAYGGLASVHFEILPHNAKSFDTDLMARIRVMQRIILLSRTIRERRKLSLKFPLRSLTVIHHDAGVLANLEDLVPLIKDEINVMEVRLSNDTSLIKVSAASNFRALGARVGKDMKAVSDAVRRLDEAQISRLEHEPLEVCGHLLGRDDVVVTRSINADKLASQNLDAESEENLTVILDLTKDDTLEYKAMMREVANRVQKMRKELGLSIDDDITVYVQTDDEALLARLADQVGDLVKILKKNAVVTRALSLSEKLHSETLLLRNCKVEVVIVKS